MIVQSSEVAGLWGLPTAVGPWLEPLATAGLVVVLVIFMLLERQELRDRVIRLFGHGTLAVTTRAFDEAGSRVSRYLFRAVPREPHVRRRRGRRPVLDRRALLRCCGASSPRRCATCRYVGPWIAALAPFLVSLARLRRLVAAIARVGLSSSRLELVHEPRRSSRSFYAGAAGISQVGLLVAIAFWTWLWGGVGLLLATPLTVCLVVMGKHVPGLEFLSTLMAEARA